MYFKTLKLSVSKQLTIVMIFLLPMSNYSQDFSEFWEGYFSYLNIIKIADAGNKVYAAAENALFSYNPTTNQLETITTLNGLSGEFITTIHYSSDYQLLLIGYQNGLIEVFKESNNDVLKVIDIINKTTIPPNNKKINHFNEHNGLVYISTDYGISVYDIDNLEFSVYSLRSSRHAKVVFYRDEKTQKIAFSSYDRFMYRRNA